jgi:hypothetical protein
MEPLTDVFGTQTSAAGLSFGLRGVVDWSVQQPFLDVFKTARPWLGHSENQWGAYGSEDLGAMGVLDANGWITDLPSGVDRVETFILTEMPVEAQYTAGSYRLSYDGAGEIHVHGAEIISQANGEIWFNYTPTGEGLVTISITGTDPQNTGNYLRNIEVVKQEYIPAFEAGALFNPLWLDMINDAQGLRFMDWQETNNSQVQSWSDRPTVGTYSYAEGVPLEVMVALANATGTEPWFNMPWNADEAYIRNFATYVRDNLDPDLRAHIEMSNEVWNWMFEQAREASADAQERFGQDLGDGWMQEYGARAAGMASVLDTVYAGSEDQLVKVIATHTGWPGLEESILQAPNWQALSPANAAPYLSFDTYAITGYFSGGLGTDAKAPLVLEWIAQSEAQARQDAATRGLSGSAADAYVAEHRFDQAVALAVRELRDGSVTGDAEDSLVSLFELFAYHKSVADAHGLDLVMYEGGTHVAGSGQWINNDLLTEFFTHLNYSDGMGQLYTELLAGWEAAGGTLFNAFVDVSEPSQWGSWGSLRHLQDSTARHDAVVEFMESHPAPATMKDGIVGNATFDFGPVPEPTPQDEDDTPVVTPQPRPEPQPQPQPQPEPTPEPTPEQPVQVGFNVDFYAVEEGTERMSQITFDTPIHSMVVNSVNESDDDGSFWDGGPADFFAGRYTGVLNVQEAGVYTFATLSDDGTVLYVNGQSVVDNDGLHGEVFMQNEVYLEAGQHDIRLDYFEHEGGASVTLGYGGPDTGGELVIMDGTVVTPLPRPQPQPQTDLAPVAAFTERAGDTAQSASRVEQDEAASEIELSGSQSSYTLRIADDSIVIEDRRAGGEAPRVLSSEDRVDFTENLPVFGEAGIDLDLFDGMARLTDDAMDTLTELYIAYFNRAPDAVGLFFWGNQLADGMSLREIAGYFFDQPETRALYGDVADLSEFVSTVYQNVLGRAPDASGLEFWLDLLESNAAVTPSTFIMEILAGAKAATGSAADAAYLENKVALGSHFAITRGMSDVEEASMVMSEFDGSQISLEEGLARSDAFYEEALSATDGDFLIQLVGFADAPFAI